MRQDLICFEGLSIWDQYPIRFFCSAWIILHQQNFELVYCPHLCLLSNSYRREVMWEVGHFLCSAVSSLRQSFPFVDQGSNCFDTAFFNLELGASAILANLGKKYRYLLHNPKMTPVQFPLVVVLSRVLRLQYEKRVSIVQGVSLLWCGLFSQ